MCAVGSSARCHHADRAAACTHRLCPRAQSRKQLTQQYCASLYVAFTLRSLLSFGSNTEQHAQRLGIFSDASHQFRGQARTSFRLPERVLTRLHPRRQSKGASRTGSTACALLCSQEPVQHVGKISKIRSSIFPALASRNPNKEPINSFPMHILLEVSRFSIIFSSYFLVPS